MEEIWICFYKSWNVPFNPDQGLLEEILKTGNPSIEEKGLFFKTNMENLRMLQKKLLSLIICWDMVLRNCIGDLGTMIIGRIINLLDTTFRKRPYVYLNQRRLVHLKEGDTANHQPMISNFFFHGK